MPKKIHRHELIMGRIAFSAEVDVGSTSPTLDPMSMNLAERLAAKASDPNTAKRGINVSGLSDAGFGTLLRSFPIIPD